MFENLSKVAKIMADNPIVIGFVIGLNCSHMSAVKPFVISN